MEIQINAEDKSNDHAYFAIVPRIVILNTTPHELALWITVKDILGQYQKCKLNTKQLAAYAGMSTGMVSKARKSLIKKGLLAGRMEKDEGFQAVYNLWIPDIWEENISFSKEHRTIQERVEYRESQGVHTVNDDKRSPHEHSLEGERSPGETKKKEEVNSNSINTIYSTTTTTIQNPKNTNIDENIKQYLDSLGVWANMQQKIIERLGNDLPTIKLYFPSKKDLRLMIWRFSNGIKPDEIINEADPGRYVKGEFADFIEH